MKKPFRYWVRMRRYCLRIDHKPALAEKGYANPNPHTFALQFLVEKSSDGSGAGRMNSAKGHC